jgi:nicotinate-nucleotide--dimethylbenzimidazole phosphoribosyltransferase
LHPAVKERLIFAHRSAEQGHRHVLAALEVKPLLDLDLRLGEGTGAALGMGLVEAAVRLLNEMATFAEAGVAEDKVQSSKSKA